MSKATRKRVSDATLKEWLVEFHLEHAGLGLFKGVNGRDLPRKDAKPVITELLTLRAIMRTVAARKPTNFDSEFNHERCIYCGASCDGDAGDPPLAHLEQCPYRQAVEWIKGAGDE